MEKKQNNENVVRSDDFYISDKAEEITLASENNAEYNSAYDELLADIEQNDDEDTVVDSSIDTDGNENGNESHFITDSDNLSVDDKELQDILFPGEGAVEENRIPGEYNTGSAEQSDETIASIVFDTSSNNLGTEHNQSDIVSASVEDIVQNILEGYDDLSNEDEDEDQDYLEITDPNEHIYNSAISELSTMVEDIKYDSNLYPDPSCGEKHEDIMVRIESLWAELIEVWPTIQKQPHVVANIEELWKTLKETNNNIIEIPPEFDRLFHTTNSSTFDSKTGSDLHRSIIDDNVVNIDTLFSEKEQEPTPNTNTPFDSNVHTESNVPYDDELSELVLSILGENSESGETAFQGQTPIENELESNQSDNEQAEAKTITTFVDDKLGDLVSNILANNNNRFAESPSEINNETNSNTLDIDVSDEVDAILRKYAGDEEITPDVITGSEFDESEISTPDNKHTADSLLQELLDSESDSSNGYEAEDTQPDLPSISSEKTSSLAAPSISEKLKTVSQSTQNTPVKLESLVKTSATSSTSLNKTVVNTALATDTPTSGWKWALASLIPIAIIAVVWTYLKSDDEADQKATADNMVLYASKRESTSSSTLLDATREESIEDIIKRMSETDTTSPVETGTYNNFDSDIIPQIAQETVREEFATEMIASPAIEPTSDATQNSEQNLQGLTEHISRLEATITDLQQTAVAQDSAATQDQETANTLPVEKITQLIDMPAANLQRGVDQRFKEFYDRITRLEAAVNELQQSAQLARQKVASENNANALFSQGNQNEINILTKRLSEIESSLQDQAVKFSNNESAQDLQQKELQQKILNGNKDVANEASVALSQGNQQHIQSLSHRIEEVESSLQKYATDISDNKVMVGNTASTKADNDASDSADSDRILIEKDSSGVTITLNKPVTASGKPANNNKYQMITHIVVKNDTLWSIAKRYVKNPYLYHELARLSNIKNPDLIYPGNRVRIIQFID